MVTVISSNERPDSVSRKIFTWYTIQSVLHVPWWPGSVEPQ